MSRCRVSARARLDLREIHDYIAQDDPRAAARFIDGLLQKGRALADFPDLGEKRDDLAPSLRIFSAGSYVILYRPIERGIEMVRIISGACDIDALFDLDS